MWIENHGEQLQPVIDDVDSIILWMSSVQTFVLPLFKRISQFMDYKNPLYLG